jgi:hypothetical protein
VEILRSNLFSGNAIFRTTDEVYELLDDDDEDDGE